ncbi:iroquois-class homeodomain protein irx-3-like [Musca vetustissima]|uniref:iroquois-class homeodomain protein irx-3-like n=1 Tax=Musca vetustissima TaxID=27455 RepID=UPI002AB7EA62|nr:iroquois-class homeodomain protein irx-3-like [Musca vetustissima]
MEKPNRPQRNRRHSRRAWPPEDDLHYPRAAKRLFTPEIKRMLKEWLVRRRENPYPSREEKKRLAIDTGLTYTQICNWFANWRRKLKNAEREKSKKSWGHLIKNYNTNAKGNVEQFSISSEDSIWEEEEQQYRRHQHSDNDYEDDDDLDSMCDLDGSSGSGSTDITTTERNDNGSGSGCSTISSSIGQSDYHSMDMHQNRNGYTTLTLHNDPSDLFIGREVDVLTTNATCQITQSAASAEILMIQRHHRPSHPPPQWYILIIVDSQ